MHVCMWIVSGSSSSSTSSYSRLTLCHQNDSLLFVTGKPWSEEADEEINVSV